MQHYHYIFTGSGLSALMTVYEMLLSGKFENKSILLIDENTKKVFFTIHITVIDLYDSSFPVYSIRHAFVKYSNKC